MEEKIIVQFVVPDQSACAYYRLQQVMFNLMCNYRSRIAATHAFPQTLVSNGQSVVYLQRVLTSQWFEALQEWKEKTKVKVIIDYDDIMWEDGLPLYNRAIYHDRVNDRREALSKYLNSVADVVTCSTEFLAENLRKYHKDVRVFPNCLSYSVWGFQGRPLPKTQKMLYAGSPTHYDNLEKQYGDWEIGLVRYVQKYGVKVMGSQPPWFFEGAERVPWATANTYAKSLFTNTADCDFVVAPLAPNDFNRAKSDLKYLEAAAVGRVALVSDFEGSPYKDAHPLQKIPYKAGVKDMERIVKNCHEHYVEILKYQYEYLQKRWLDDLMPKYEELFEEVAG